MAERLGVRAETVANWERGWARPLPAHYGAAVRFLGFDPAPAGGSMASRIRARRRALGLSQAELAVRLALDEGTIGDIERGRRRTSRRVSAVLQRFLARPGES